MFVFILIHILALFGRSFELSVILLDNSPIDSGRAKLATSVSHSAEPGSRLRIRGANEVIIQSDSARLQDSGRVVSGRLSELHIVMTFGLEAGSPDCKVLEAFLPEHPTSWFLQDRRKVTFYPFLVVMQRMGETGTSFWLPYWHIVERTGTMKKQYGQWAPFMDEPLFQSLVRQARDSGCLL